MSLNFPEFYNNIKKQYDIPSNTNQDLLDLIANSRLYLRLKLKEMVLFNNPTYEKFCVIFTEYEHDSSDDDLDEEPTIAYKQILQTLSKRKQVAKDIIKIYKNLIIVLNDIIEDRKKLSNKGKLNNSKLNL